MTTERRYLIVPSWGEFQHYKNRTPTWIKNYTELLLRPEYRELSLADRGVLHGVWMLYAASAGRIYTASTHVASALATDDVLAVEEALKRLEEGGWLTAASKPRGLRTASPSRARASARESREEKKETPPSGGVSEKNARKRASHRAAADPPSAAGAVEEEPSTNGPDPESFEPDPEGRARLARILRDAADNAELERAADDEQRERIEQRQAISRRYLEEHQDELARARAALAAEIPDEPGEEPYGPIDEGDL